VSGVDYKLKKFEAFNLTDKFDNIVDFRFWIIVLKYAGITLAIFRVIKLTRLLVILFYVLTLHVTLYFTQMLDMSLFLSFQVSCSFFMH